MCVNSTSGIKCIIATVQCPFTFFNNLTIAYYPDNIALLYTLKSG